MVGIYIYTITIEARARVGAKRQGQGCQAVCSKCCVYRLSLFGDVLVFANAPCVCPPTVTLASHRISCRPQIFVYMLIVD
ncbi:GM19410 [Drosophila sechellia]|uniref:GM19410 n=1 Tax=Drosophila sechellia TaxID=7238 RepID=B4HH48_DROSE|nr:GM19410 [Drosophila sechellia]